MVMTPTNIGDYRLVMASSGNPPARIVKDSFASFSSVTVVYKGIA
jgi:hypothetical protein